MRTPTTRHSSYRPHRMGGHLLNRDMYREGHVNTAHGIVLVYSDARGTTYRLMHNGVHHHWSEACQRTERGTILRAHNLVRSLIRSEVMV